MSSCLRLSQWKSIYTSYNHPVCFWGYVWTWRSLPKQLLNCKVNSKLFSRTPSRTFLFVKKLFFRCDFCWFLTQIFETIRKHTKITTSARLWSPKPFAGVCEHTTPFVEKIRTYTKLQKLIWLQYDALNVIFSTIFAEFHVSKLQKSTLFLRLKVALKEYENGKNRYLRTFGSIEIDWRRVWSPQLIQRMP